MSINEEQIRTQIISKLHNWVGAMPDPDIPLVDLAGNKHEAVTPRQILQEVEQRTEDGEQFIQRWVEMAVEHIMDASLGIDDLDEKLQANEAMDGDSGGIAGNAKQHHGQGDEDVPAAQGRVRGA